MIVDHQTDIINSRRPNKVQWVGPYKQSTSQIPKQKQ